MWLLWRARGDQDDWADSWDDDFLEEQRMRRFLSRALHYAGRLMAPRSGPDLSGDRDVEYAWMVAKLPKGPGLVLDFGCGWSSLSLVAQQMGHRVVALDLERPALPYEVDRELVQGDVLTVDLGARRFNTIMNCSAIEHVGLAGRYGSSANPDGDLQAMRRLRSWLAPGGSMILTLPVGRDAVFAPLHRVYGPERLPRLLVGYEIVEEQFRVKDQANRWVAVDKARALAEQGSAHSYGLGLFVLRAAGDAQS
jgi:hypothetical protein